MSAALANLTGASSQTLPPIRPCRPHLLDSKPANRLPATIVRALSGNNKGTAAEEVKEHRQQQHSCHTPVVADNILFQASRRRAALGLAAVVTMSAGLGVGTSLAAEGEAENNGWWLTGPLPVPTVTNKIANEETGTRSFVRQGIYMANIGPEGSAYRLKAYAFDLMGLGDLLAGHDAWSYARRYLCLKSTFMYFDFDKVISAAPPDQKQPLTDLANRLFDSFEKLEDAVKKHSAPSTELSYAETTAILQEVMTRMA